MSNYPKAIGPYSAYREVNGLLFISGQLPINPASGEIESSDIKEQTKQSLKISVLSWKKMVSVMIK